MVKDDENMKFKKSKNIYQSDDDFATQIQSTIIFNFQTATVLANLSNWNSSKCPATGVNVTSSQLFSLLNGHEPWAYIQVGKEIWSSYRRCLGKVTIKFQNQKTSIMHTYHDCTRSLQKTRLHGSHHISALFWMKKLNSNPTRLLLVVLIAGVGGTWD